MTENHPSVFSFNFKNNIDHEIRTIVKADNSIWFVAKDVCKTLGLSNPSIALNHLDDDERAKFFLAPHVQANVISESGLYALVLRSNKPEAKPFRKWVTSEVLPQIRQTGAYSQTPTMETGPTIDQVTAFYHAASDAFWLSYRAINRHKVIEAELRRSQKAIVAIIDSIKEAYPDSVDMVKELAGNYPTKTKVKSPLTVELPNR